MAKIHTSLIRKRLLRSRRKISWSNALIEMYLGKVSIITKEKEGLKVLLDRMLSFLAEMPVDRYHDYRIFRHTRLRQYLIHRFLREQLNELLTKYSIDLSFLDSLSRIENI